MNDLVSIIMPSYNGEMYISQTINSIVAQSYRNWELLITDDCSSDKTVEIVKDYVAKDPRIKLYRLEKNSGPGVARNNSIEEAHGRYLAFCDSDDRWLPNKLEQQLTLLAKKDAACCYGAYYECDGRGNRVSILHVKPILSFKQEKHANQIGMLTGLYDTVKVGKVFMPTIRKRQDWAMWLHVIKKCRFAVGITDPIAEYHIRDNSVSRNKKDLIKYNAAIYKEVFHYPMWLAYLYTFFINIPTILFKRLMMNRPLSS